MKIDVRIMGLAPCSRYCPEMLDRMRQDARAFQSAGKGPDLTDAEAERVGTTTRPRVRCS